MSTNNNFSSGPMHIPMFIHLQRFQMASSQAEQTFTLNVSPVPEGELITESTNDC